MSDTSSKGLPLSLPSDLTRWNRAGLTRFRYVDGNAVTYLELLRQALAERFGDEAWPALFAGLPPDLENEPESERQARLLSQYGGERGDWGWEIARALARAAHVLTEHLDAYANEGYLGTATQWDHVRRLVEMLDYHPAPPASAATHLVLGAKAEGTLKRGFQVGYKPPEGGAPIVFETLEDLPVDPALDGLRPAGWNRSPLTFRLAAAGSEPAIGSRLAIDLQGVGPAYVSRLLDPLRRLATGLQDARFTLADFRHLDPQAVPPELLAAIGELSPEVVRLRLREFRGKAEVLFAFPWTGADLAPLLDLTLAEIVATGDADLALASGRGAGEIAALKEELRRVEIVLDQPVFESVRLGELAGLASSASGEGTGKGTGAAGASSLWIAPEKAEISAVDLGLTVRDPGTSEAVVVRVDRVDPLTRAIFLRDAPFQHSWQDWTLGETSLRLGAGFLSRPRLNGPGVVSCEEAHDLAAGDVAAWEEAGAWHFARVAEVDEKGLRLPASGALPAPGTEVYRGFRIEQGEGGLLFPAVYQVAVRPVGAGFTPLTAADYDPVSVSGGGSYRKLKSSAITEIFLLPQDAAASGRVVAAVPGEFVFDGSPGKLGSGQWVVADDGETLWPLTIARIGELEDHFTIVFSPAATAPRAAGVRLAGQLPASALQGVGSVYGGVLAARQIATVADLARLTAADLAALSTTWGGAAGGAHIPPVRGWELKVKAEVVLGLEADPTTLGPILGETAGAVLATDPDVLSARLARPRSTVDALFDELRLLEACLDHQVFQNLPLGHLLPAPGSGPGNAGLPRKIVRLYGRFRHTLRPEGWDRNSTPLVGSQVVLEAGTPSSIFQSRLLARGRRLILEREATAADSSPDGFTAPTQTRVAAVDEATRTVTLDLPTPLTAADGYTLGNSVLRANVVAAGHGESKPEKVLGSGDAARIHQSFVLAEAGVSFVADSTQPSGVAADIALAVDGRTFKQVPTLRDSGPADAHYIVRMTEEGYLKLDFGDGRHGRRLPGGTNNVRVSYRLGTGQAGNLGAGSLAKPVRPNRLVASVRQSAAATGGNDMENARSLRGNAPGSVLTLERAVSVRDLGHLAARQSSVWQARAFRRPTALARRESVEVVVVPAGGGPLGSLEASLGDFLRTHTLPGVDIQISPAEVVPFHASVLARIKSAEWDPELVVPEIRQALLAAFSLAVRRLGQDLFLSEVIQVVENVRGVENSRCEFLGAEAGERRIEVSERQVRYLDPAASTILLSHEEWTL